MAQHISVRAFVPSLTLPDSNTETLDNTRRAKELSIELYARLAEEGRPLFDDEVRSPMRRDRSR